MIKLKKVVFTVLIVIMSSASLMAQFKIGFELEYGSCQYVLLEKTSKTDKEALWKRNNEYLKPFMPVNKNMGGFVLRMALNTEDAKDEESKDEMSQKIYIGSDYDRISETQTLSSKRVSSLS
ncbi:MAG: hypothetical protein GY754_03810 [bacterium]|nr:hypothetical protein [bacterium]